MKDLRHYIKIVEDAQKDVWANVDMDANDSNAIMQRIWKLKYPKYTLYVDGIEDNGPVWSTDPHFNQYADNVFYISTRGNDMVTDDGCTVSIDSAWSNQFKGVIGPYIQSCFEHMENVWKKEYPDLEAPGRIIRLYSRDGSDGAWEHLANKLNADLEDDPSH
jgi:hypothetical protein